MSEYTVLDFAGDSSESDSTESIQKAIDACAAAGGGTVTVPAGVYRCATIRLKDHVTLNLQSGARLVAYDDPSRYPRLDGSIYAELGYALLVAESVTNVSIVGRGTIDGNGAAFHDPCRPRCVYFISCERVRIENVALCDSASWMIHLRNCTDVVVRGVTIRSNVQENNDGIDVDSCRRVRISDCDIESGDDGIAFKSNDRVGTEDVVVTNCTIKSDWAALRIGPESVGGFRRITVSNCVVRETWGTGIKLQMVQGAEMTDIIFTAIVMDRVTGPFSIRLGGWSQGPLKPIVDTGVRGKKLERIRFSHIVATVPGYTDRNGQNWPDERFAAMTITGLPDLRIKDLLFDDISIRFPGGGTDEHAKSTVLPDRPDEYPEYLLHGVPGAYGAYMAHVDDVRFRDVSFELADSDRRPALICHDATDVSFSGCRFEVSEGVDSVIRLHETRGVTIRASKLDPRAAEPVRVCDASSEYQVLDT